MLVSSSKDILSRLVAMPTISRSSNLELIAYAAQILTDAGFTVRHIAAGEGRENLFASYGRTDRAGVILSGHTDVVPVEGQRWDTDPFELTEREGRLFGRGTADMKGFIACALRAAARVSQFDLKLPVHIALSCDEEIGCVGVRTMLSELVAAPPAAALCIVGEPTSMRVATSHKGKIAARATCRGREAHSALAPSGLNAIHLATDLVNAIRRYQSEIADSPKKDTRFEVPYSTIHVGQISGGIALNIVPAQCVVDFEIRNVPTDDRDALLARICRDAEEIVGGYEGFSEAGISIQEIVSYPGLDAATNDAADFVGSLSGGNQQIGLSFGTEAGLFKSSLGLPTLVCGPGSMDQGHKPNEFVSIDQLDRCDAMLERLFERLTIDKPLR